MKKIILLLSVFILFASFSHAQSWLWGRVSSVPAGNPDDYAIAADSHGNGYVGDQFADTIYFDTTRLVSQGISSCLAKYKADGKLAWAVQSTGINSDVTCTFIAADNNENIYMVGGFYHIAVFGHDTLINNSTGGEFYLTKYDSNGNVLWVQHSIAPSTYSSCGASYVATDLNGNIYITGSFTDTAVLGSASLYTPVLNYRNVFVAKYNSGGNIIWAKQSGSPNISYKTYTTSVATDAAGNVFITGTFEDTLVFGATTLFSPYKAPFLVKYDQAGNVLWAVQGYTANKSLFGTTPNSVVTDKTGEIYITGDFDGTFTLGTYSFTTNLENDAFLAKYNESGSLIWAQKSFEINNDSWSGNSVCADNNNHIYVSFGCNGHKASDSCVLTFGVDSFRIISNSNDVSGLIEFDTSGKALCGSMSSTGGDDLNTIACDPSGKYVYFGGDLYAPAIFGDDTLSIPPFGIIEVPLIARWQPCTTPVDTITPPPTDTTKKEPCGNVFVPNAFSPNGDGQNDVLYVRGDCINTMDFIIYDRWGNKIFESGNLNNGWDGKYRGQPMNTGSYAYYLSASLNDGTTLVKKGSVALVR